MRPMGRPRRKDRDLPPMLFRKRGRYYYGQEGIALGKYLPAALKRWAELRGEALPKPNAGTFADAAAQFERDELPGKAAKTQEEYTRQLKTLVKVFGAGALDAIKPKHIRAFLDARPSIAGTREKALFSAVFNFARGRGMTDAPNPCAGIKGKQSRRDVYVTDGELSTILVAADRPLRDFLELAYHSGQRPSDVLKMTRADVKDGALWVQQNKTGAKVRLDLIGPLADVVARVLALSFPVQAMNLVLDERGQRLTLKAMQKRFAAVRLKAGGAWQIRDLRAKAGTDMEDAGGAQRLLGHRNRTTTDVYLRDRRGELARPVMRKIGK
jgi:integrase